ncbi:MAG: DUF2161 domain-containing phosphodiesterase [Shimia sp.]
MTAPREADLYAPVKALFERQGFTVKGEVGAADLVARRGEDLVVVELKLRFSLALYHQAIERLRVTDAVFVAVARPTGAQARRMLKDNTAMARRLGIGLIVVRADGVVEVLAQPGPYAPRRSAKKRTRLLAAFDRLHGDPNDGGATRHGLVTGYRQDALRCARYLAEYGPSRGAAVAKDTGVAVATRIMRDNHYGWFGKVRTGVYDLTPEGRRGLADWGDAV